MNTVGYSSGSPKLAFTSVKVQSGDVFKIVQAKTLETVFEGSIDVNKVKSTIFGDIIHELNFTSFDKPGVYRLWIPSLGVRSSQFEIANQVYNEAVKTAIESYYYQRCGTEVNIGTSWTHKVCHIDDAVYYGNGKDKLDVSGGWHDAGDYGKFSVNTAVSLAYLLYLYDHQPDKFYDGQLRIPENSNNVPDLLDEARWAMQWLMKMQNEKGGVFHKVQKKKWTGEYLPHNDPDTRYIFEVSSTATADFAAVSAIGSRLFKEINPHFSDSLRKAAVRAWDYLSRHPEIVPDGGFTNPSDVRGGEYGDTNDADERLWASVELYRLTGETKYHEYFLKNYQSVDEPKMPPVSWKSIGEFAIYSYLRLPEKDQNLEARKIIIEKIRAYADKLVKQIAGSDYRIALKENEFYWGSNSVVLGYAFDLIQAYEFTEMELYKEAALDQLHYILGRNPFGLSFVTGIGSTSVKNPYHQFSSELNVSKPVPGMLVGGPNNHNNLNDQVLSAYPGKAYEDNSKNYVVNETAINYTAPFVYVAGYFSNLAKTEVASE
ncbi:MAG: glycoside hydrolase family 9 protein [Gracilimonas sp.]|uniref:glycoside hydrolase family 9 protein n=1 Tax=Gracilimonas sp. TaxID=1974203 RepID=UPI0019C081BA|nr:glycoside hydrolase family 9 protein [Gracilimonas sp.]MBD3615437.1 glycoside hydrolase family 9 protein [Gracilimonas sp.]